ncbi:HAMP domain-containing protein [bacterium]|nr:HAMP domain-containing protein [bacterium]
MSTQRQRKLAKNAKRFIGRLSIRRRIAIAILMSFIIILPSVSLSLFYFSGLLRGIKTITENDVRLGRMASDLTLIMLDIRRDERNYRMFGNPTERTGIEEKIARTKSLVSEAYKITPVQDQDIINNLSDHFTVYSNSFNMLVEHITENPPEEEVLKRARTQFSQKLLDFQTTYLKILTEIEKASPAQRDSVLSRANENLSDIFLNFATSESQTMQPSYIQENLENSRQDFLETAHSLAEKSWENMEAHKEESLRIEARAKRNIISVLIVTGLFCILMVTYIPRYIVRPITSLNRIFRKAEEGDYYARAVVQSNDEVGDLAVSYNQMMNRLRGYDELKTKKIASQKRSVDRLLENINVPICILNDKLFATYYNTLFANLFVSIIAPKPPAAGLDFSKIHEMGKFVEELRKKILHAENEFVLATTLPDGTGKTFKGRLVRDHVMSLESIILVGAAVKNEENRQ